MAFKIKRGTNISHWLSQSDRRGTERKTRFTQTDVRRIADWGFDHIRLPIDETQMWNEAGRQETEAFDLMDSALDWAEESGLKVIVDLHILRSHYFNQETQPKLFTDPEEVKKFAGLWRQLSARLKRRHNDRVAYELMNEPVAEDAGDWNRVAMAVFQAIRELEEQRTIVLGSNRWNSIGTFDQLQVPDDKNTILTFHFYNPMLITHHRASWWRNGGQYDGKIQYPGLPIPADVLAKTAEPLRSIVAPMNQHYDRNAMVADMAKPLAVARKTGLPLFCGEFGVIHLAPQQVRLAWYRDLISVFNEHKISWANWDYMGGFGILDGQRQSTGIAEAMLSAV